MSYVFGVRDLPHSVSLKIKLSPQVPLPDRVPTLAGELEPFFWMMWPALGLRPDLSTVAVGHLVLIIVGTMKMLESPVKVCYYIPAPHTFGTCISTVQSESC